MRQDAAAHEEHGGRAQHAERLHQPGRGTQQPTAQAAQATSGGAVALKAGQRQAGVIQLDDGRHQAINADRQDDGHQGHHAELGEQGGAGHTAQGDGDDLGREDEVGADGATDLVLLQRHQVHRWIGQGFGQRSVLGVVLGAVDQPVPDLLEAFEAQIGPADHQQGGDQPGGQGADGQGRGHQDGLVDQGALGHGPDHRQLAAGIDAVDLLGIERQVVTEHPGGLLGRHLGQHRHVVEHGRDVVDQGKQVGSGHGSKVKKGCRDANRPCAQAGGGPNEQGTRRCLVVRGSGPGKLIRQPRTCSRSWRRSSGLPGTSAGRPGPGAA